MPTRREGPEADGTLGPAARPASAGHATTGMRVLAALAALATLALPAAAQPPAATGPFPAAQTALVRRAIERLAPLPFTRITEDPARPVAIRRLSPPGAPRDLLIGFYAAPPGQPPSLAALQWGRETRHPGGCPNGLTALEITTFFLPRPYHPEQWGAWRYRGCLATPTALAGPATAAPLSLDDPATRALAHAILERLTTPAAR